MSAQNARRCGRSSRPMTRRYPGSRRKGRPGRSRAIRHRERRTTECRKSVEPTSCRRRTLSVRSVDRTLVNVRAANADDETFATVGGDRSAGSQLPRSRPGQSGEPSAAAWTRIPDGLHVQLFAIRACRHAQSVCRTVARLERLSALRRQVGRQARRAAMVRMAAKRRVPASGGRLGRL